MLRSLGMTWSVMMKHALLMVALAWPGTAGAMDKLGWSESHEIIRRWLDIGPYDDIIHEGYAGFVTPVDLDSDGRDEIVYYASHHCVHASFDCPNGINVLSSVTSKRATAREPVIDEYEARARRTGYEINASAQIPGDVRSLEVKGTRIDVDFTVQDSSPICRREHRSPDEPDRCPAPGRYRWSFHWTPGKLTRLAEQAYTPDDVRSAMPMQLHDLWVTAGSSCEQVLDDDRSRSLKIDHERLEGLGEDGLVRTVDLIARTPWTWRIVTRRPGLSTVERDALYSLSNLESRLIMIEETRVRTFDRCPWYTLDDLRRATRD